MQILTASPIPEDSRRYWALGGADAALEAVDRDIKSGTLSIPHAAYVLSTVPLVALEEAARRTGHRRLRDAIDDAAYQEALYVALSFHPELESTLSRGAIQYWLRLAWEDGGRDTRSVPPTLAAQLRTMELHGYRTDDLRLPHRGLHLAVPPEAGLELSDSNRVKWTATDLLIVEESEPHLWRLCIEALTSEGRSAHVLTMHLPPGMSLDAAVAQHEAKAAPGFDWRPLWTWALGAVLSLTPPASRA
ncbi:hypothetical protein HUW62_31940 [Myxococcus sp. AM011]|uniref:hypothetical protein n=1 Tax=Myxococcus sp. AM011 TaxID=2745200 RepID=UPI0015956AF7|nr:hypothetical protein [Myxococcus sp. AM011]NVJ25844.1 hypothetical protein [Myxococcus sp. AM011]